MAYREFEIIIKIDTDAKYQALNKIKELGMEVVAIKCLEKRRTSQQNRALFLYFRLLAEELNLCGMDMRQVIRKDIDISWTPENIKHFLWLPLMKALTGNTSTRTMKTTDIDLIYDNLNRVISERCGVSIPFPSIDSLMLYDEEV